MDRSSGVRVMEGSTRKYKNYAVLKHQVHNTSGAQHITCTTHQVHNTSGAHRSISDQIMCLTTQLGFMLVIYS